LTGQSFSYMTSVKFLPVSIAVILFYTFPILTFIFSAVVNGRGLKLAPFISLAAALVGIYFLVQDGTSSWNINGVFWALFAALMQASINVISPKIGSVSGWGMVKYTSYLPALLFLGAYLWNRETFSYVAIGWSFAAAAAFCSGLYLFYQSVAKIGAVRTANLLYFEPVFTIMISLFIFGDRLVPLQWVGAVIIVLATFTLEIQERRLAT